MVFCRNHYVYDDYGEAVVLARNFHPLKSHSVHVFIIIKKLLNYPKLYFFQLYFLIF